jgi:hypothetical protein
MGSEARTGFTIVGEHAERLSDAAVHKRLYNLEVVDDHP